MNDQAVNVSRKFDAPIEKVFDAWLDARTLSLFMLPMSGMPNPAVKNDPREGGRFEILMQVGDNQVPHTGTYLVIERPHRLHFSWESPAVPEGSKVEITFTEQADNQTLLELVHTRFNHQESRDNHEKGWALILETLAANL